MVLPWGGNNADVLLGKIVQMGENNTNGTALGGNNANILLGKNINNRIRLSVFFLPYHIVSTFLKKTLRAAPSIVEEEAHIFLFDIFNFLYAEKKKIL